MVVTAAICTAAHADHPARLRHLVVDLAEGGSHLVGQCTGHNHHIRLSGGSTEDNSQAVLVVSGRGEVHHLHGAACQTEGHGPQRTLAGPVGNLIQSGSARQSVYGQVKSANRSTNKTYCMAPSFFSWLGNGTSLRALPEAVSCEPDCDWRSSAVADLIDEVERAATGWARGRARARARARRGRAA